MSGSRDLDDSDRTKRKNSKHDTSGAFVKINTLCERLESEIRKLCSHPVDKDFINIRSLAIKDQHPEAEYALKLFDYLLLALKAKEKEKEKSPSVVYNIKSSEPNVAADPGEQLQIAGWSAALKNIFWLRVANAVFSFTAAYIMFQVPYIHEDDITVSELLLVTMSIRNMI